MINYEAMSVVEHELLMATSQNETQLRKCRACGNLVEINYNDWRCPDCDALPQALV